MRTLTINSTEYKINSAEFDRVFDPVCGVAVYVAPATRDCPEIWDSCDDEIPAWEAKYRKGSGWVLYGAHGGADFDHEAERPIEAAALRGLVKAAQSAVTY